MRTETDALLSLQRYVAAALPDMTEVMTVVEDEQPERPFAVVAADDGWAPDDRVDLPMVTMPATVYVYVEGDTRKVAREVAEQVRETLWHALAVGIGDGRPRLVPLLDYTGRPCVQTVRLLHAKAGDWTLALGDDVTAPLPVKAQPRDLRLALEELPGLAGNVWVYGKLGGPWSVRFDGALRGQEVEPLVGDPAGLTPRLVGEDPEVVVTTDLTGSPDPWRDRRDFLRVDGIRPGGLPDPREPRKRTVTVGLRLTWGRGGRVPSAEMTLRSIEARPI